MNRLSLPGLDGSNPLAFLAAVGVVEALTDQEFDVTLHWQHHGTWVPVLGTPLRSLDELVERLDADRFARRGCSVLDLEHEGKRDLKLPLAKFREFLLQQVEQCSPDKRVAVDWAAAFGSDVVADRRGERTKPTALHFTTSQQQFLGMVRDLLSHTTPEDLDEALRGPWRYQRDLPVLCWDSTDSRAYALRASNPAEQKKTGVPGADWLAFRGLVAFPTAPVGAMLRTTACPGTWKHGCFVWPLWSRPIGRDTIRLLLRFPWVRDPDPAVLTVPRAELAARGIDQVFSSRIVRGDAGGLGRMSPAQVLAAPPPSSSDPRRTG